MKNFKLNENIGFEEYQNQVKNLKNNIYLDVYGYDMTSITAMTKQEFERIVNKNCSSYVWVYGKNYDDNKLIENDLLFHLPVTASQKLFDEMAAKIN